MPEVKPLTHEQYDRYHRGAQLSYEDYVKTHCPCCSKQSDCPHRDNYRRLPRYVGGLGLCENLKQEAR